MQKLQFALLISIIFLNPSFSHFSEASSTEKVKVGFVGPRTGSAAATGAAFQEGIDLALEKFKNVEVIFEDTGGVPEKAAAAFEKLVNKDKVVMIMGESHSSSALAEIELSNRYQMPFVVAEAWSDAIMQKGYSSVFRAGPSNSHVGNNAVAGFIKANGFKKVAIVNENSDWGKGITAITLQNLKEAKIDTQAFEVDLKAKDFYGVLNQVKTSKPDLVVAYIYSFGLHTFVAQAAETGVTPQSLILDGAGVTSLWPEFWPNVGKAGQRELFVSSMHPDVHPNNVSKEFFASYKKKFNKEPSDYKSRSAYTMIELAADVAKRAKSTQPKDVIDALEKTKLATPEGTIEFGTKAGSASFHQWSPDMLVAQWVFEKLGDQKQVVVYPKKLATGKLLK